MRIAVIGSGYVGLVGAACLARIGHDVWAVDADPKKVLALRAGTIPIYEPGLEAIVNATQAEGRLRFTTELGEALEGVELVFIAVGTPADEDGATDLVAVTAAAARIGSMLGRPATVVIKSTVPVGTTDRLQKLVAAELRARGITWRVPVIGNPEFLREGSAVHDFMDPDRIVVGAASADDASALLKAYEPLTARGARLLRMSTRSAELSKYAANAMLATRVSFINEIAAIAEASGADIEEVREGIGSDARIGRDFLRAGIGYGGSCFPKDVSSLTHTAIQHGVRPAILQAVEQVNGGQRRWAFDRLNAFYAGRGGLRGRRIAVWGLAFKPGTDDMREAPSLAMIEQLLGAGAQVAVFDPVAIGSARRLLDGDARIAWCHSAAAAIDNADALVLATEWDEFRHFSPTSAAAALRDGLVLDGRNVLDGPAWAAAGLQLLQVGRPPLRPMRDAAAATAASAVPTAPSPSTAAQSIDRNVPAAAPLIA